MNNFSGKPGTVADWSDGVTENWSGADEERFPNNPALQQSITPFPTAIGQDLGLIGADITLDLTTLKPILDVTLQAAHPNIGWTKQGLDGLEILVDRGTGAFGFLAFDTMPDYLDTAPLPAPGTSAVWKYKAIYRLADEQIGQWSDVAS